MKIKIQSGSAEATAELKNTETAKAVYEQLPLEGSVNTWGDEIYFSIPLSLELEEGASDVVDEGDVAYWPQGRGFCIFFGKTPASQEGEIRAASEVNVFGKIGGDAKVFKDVSEGESIKVTKGD